MVKQNKFTMPKAKATEQKKPVPAAAQKGNSEIITKGEKKFKICGKCHWMHPVTETKCRFCGNKI